MTKELIGQTEPDFSGEDSLNPAFFSYHRKVFKEFDSKQREKINSFYLHDLHNCTNAAVLYALTVFDDNRITYQGLNDSTSSLQGFTESEKEILQSFNERRNIFSAYKNLDPGIYIDPKLRVKMDKVEGAIAVFPTLEASFNFFRQPNNSTYNDLFKQRVQDIDIRKALGIKELPDNATWLSGPQAIILINLVNNALKHGTYGNLPSITFGDDGEIVVENISPEPLPEDYDQLRFINDRPRFGLTIVNLMAKATNYETYVNQTRQVNGEYTIQAGIRKLPQKTVEINQIYPKDELLSA